MTMPNVNQDTRDSVAVLTALPRVNLLPAEIAAAAKFRRFQLAMGGALVAAVAVVGALYVHGQSSVKSAQDELDAAKAQQATLQNTLNSLQGVQDVYTQVAAKQAMLTQAMGAEVRWSQYLADLSLRVPDKVWLTTVTASQTATGLSGTPTATTTTTPGVTQGIGTVTFAGTAFSHNDVAAWLDVLAKERGFADAYFSNATEKKVGPRTLVDYTSSVVVTADAKSNRYTAPAGS
jgi:Tfp pilus assembly protein PilN